MKKYFLFILSIIILPYSISSQINQTNETNSSKSVLTTNTLSDFFNETEFKISLGITNFNGDISNSINIKTAGEISFLKRINSLISIEGSILKGSFSGTNETRNIDEYIDPYPGLNLYEGNGEYFVTDFSEIDIQILYNLSEKLVSESVKMPEKIIFHIKGGFGLNKFNSINRNIDSENPIYSYGYIGENEGYIDGSIEKSSFIDSPNELVYLIGLVAKYDLDDKLSLIVDLTTRIGNTDYWDTYNNDSKKDKFNILSIGISYTIGNSETE